MAGWLAALVILAVAGREAMRELDAFQVMELRSLVGMLMFYPIVAASGGVAAMGTSRPLQHIIRNVVHYGAQYGWFVALALIPLAQVVALEFTMPLWTVLIAAAFLGERMTTIKGLAVVLGLIGVIVIVRPALGEVVPGQLVALVVAAGFAVSVTMVKSLTRTEATVAIIFWMLVVQSVLGLVPALLVWRWPSIGGWAWIVVIAFCGTFSHYCMARAMQHAEATTVVPMDFLRVPLTAIAGWLVYAERIDLLTVTGAAMIVAANLMNLREVQMRDRARTTS
ncbi:MAG TPA: DMT family transporter [Casimicrobiaceae bacterium]|nr:DMT family transporter [Casimicrobiaceae bacterium]